MQYYKQWYSSVRAFKSLGKKKAEERQLLEKKHLKNALHTGTLNYWTRLYFNELYFCLEGIIIENWRTSQDSLVRQNDLPPVFSNRFFSAPLLLAIMKIIGKDLWTAKIINQKVHLLLSATRQRTRVKWFLRSVCQGPSLGQVYFHKYSNNFNSPFVGRALSSLSTSSQVPQHA